MTYFDTDILPERLDEIAGLSPTELEFFEMGALTIVGAIVESVGDVKYAEDGDGTLDSFIDLADSRINRVRDAVLAGRGTTFEEEQARYAAEEQAALTAAFEAMFGEGNVPEGLLENTTVLA